MESNIESLKVKREKTLQRMEEKIEAWDGSYEAAMEIIEQIDLAIGELENINGSIKKTLVSIPYDGVYEKKILAFKESYGRFLEKLEIEKAKLFKLMKETRLKDEVKDSYIVQERKSIFIDKDL